MKFSLIKQLFIVALCTLILPWTGCQYVREMEALIRQQQSNTLQAFIKPLAENLKEQDAFQAFTTSSSMSPSPFFAPHTDAPIIIDGYQDEWITYSTTMLVLPDDTANSTRPNIMLSTVNQEYLFVFLSVRDPQVSYYNPQQAALHQHDWIRLVSHAQEFHIFTSAPGNTQTMRYDPTTRQRLAFARLEGNWQEHDDGYQVELKIPRDLVADGIQIEVIDGTSAKPRVLISSHRTLAPLLVPSRELTQWLQRYNSNPWDILIVDPQGWPLSEASQEHITQPRAPSLANHDELKALLLNRIYRFFLEAVLPVNYAFQWPLAGTQLSHLHQRIPLDILLDPNNKASSVTRWYALPQNNQSALLAVQPVVHNGSIKGYVLATQTEKAWLSFTNDALRRVMNLSLLSFAILVLILLGYAVWLSLRIKRLKQQAEESISSDGTIVPFTPSHASDELGALSQSYTDLLIRVKNYNEYLQSLTHKLAHEIRTPLAIVKSSLEMLGTVQGDEQKTYIERALSGNQRLANILNAMSESSQVEQLVQHADFEGLPLNPLLTELVSAYQTTYPAWRFALQLPATECSVSGNPELLAQMLDKLVDNARDFTPRGETIHVNLQPDTEASTSRYWLAVCNPGSQLPDTMRDQLFDSLISLRERSADAEGTHLGLGLYIVRLIAQAHSGRVEAFNLADGKGVCFRVSLPTAGDLAPIPQN